MLPQRVLHVYSIFPDSLALQFYPKTDIFAFLQEGLTARLQQSFQIFIFKLVSDFVFSFLKKRQNFIICLSYQMHNLLNIPLLATKNIFKGRLRQGDVARTDSGSRYILDHNLT